MKSPLLRTLPVAVVLAAVSYAIAKLPEIVALLGLGDAPMVELVLSRVLHAIVWLLLARLLNLLVEHFLWEGMVRRALGAPVPVVLKQMSRIAVYFVALCVIVHFVLGKSVLGFITALGAFGVVLGFALRGLFNDIVTGVAINVDRPFAIGDWLSIRHGSSPIVGQVKEITWRTTVLQQTDGNIHVVPNRHVGDSPFVNYSKPTTAARFTTEVILDFSVPPARATRILMAAAKAVQREEGFLTEPEPQVLASEIKPHGVDYLVRFWITPWQPLSPTRARNAIHASILHHLQRAGLTPAYPKEDVFHAAMPERNLTTSSNAHLVAIVAQIELFAPLSYEEIEQLVGRSHRREYEEGDVLIAQGDEGDSAFIVLEGLVEVLIAGEGGAEVRVDQVRPGEFFGEMSLLTGDPRTATIRAATSVVVTEVTKESVTPLLESRPELLESISLLVAERRVRMERARQAGGGEKTGDDAAESLASQLYDRMRSFFSR